MGLVDAVQAVRMQALTTIQPNQTAKVEKAGRQVIRSQVHGKMTALVMKNIDRDLADVPVEKFQQPQMLLVMI